MERLSQGRLRKFATAIVLFGIFSILLQAFDPVSFAHEHKHKHRRVTYEVHLAVAKVHTHVQKKAEKRHESAQKHSHEHRHGKRLHAYFSHQYDFVCSWSSRDKNSDILTHIDGAVLGVIDGACVPESRSLSFNRSYLEPPPMLPRASKTVFLT